MEATTTRVEGYLAIATATLIPSSRLDCDLFVRHGSDDAPIRLYRERAYPFTSDDLERLCSQGVRQLFVRLADVESYQRYLHEHVLASPNLPATTRVAAIREATRSAFREAARATDSDKLVALANDMGREFATMFCDETILLSELFQILDHDYYTFTHVCNVSVYSLLLAQKLGIHDPGDLSQLATGAMLHDIGKRAIAPHILNKPSRPSKEEWDIIRLHPTIGFGDLHQRTDLTWAQLMMVYQHHEHLDGTGYPVQILQDEIHPWAKICSVADVFDALTSHRPYRKPLTTRDALEYLMRHAVEWFELDLIRAWEACVEGI